jgi:hypothetical protein
VSSARREEELSGFWAAVCAATLDPVFIKDLTGAYIFANPRA